MPLIREVSIENYKSIRKLTLELGRVNVLIGANGSGKSNILEAIALGAAASRNKLDNEYLVPRGIRITDPRFMSSALAGNETANPITITLQKEGEISHGIEIDFSPRALDSSWRALKPSASNELMEEAYVKYMKQKIKEHLKDKVEDFLKERMESVPKEKLEEHLDELLEKSLSEYGKEKFIKEAEDGAHKIAPPDFLIYAPENSALRIFQAEPQILPLGVKGEGLFAHMKALHARGQTEQIDAIAEHLALLDWFERFEIPKDLAPGERSLLIRDRYLVEGALFDQRSANEGFLFLLFYLTLFISDETPGFFAIDNVDTSLNPKLVTTFMEQLVELAKKHGKQVILTTHNPAVLDGIDLLDDDQRLFVTERDDDGATRIRRVKAPKPLGEDLPVALSEAFMRGYLGGLPKNF